MASGFEDRKLTKSLTASWNGSGAETAGSTATISMPASAVVYAQLTGTFTATITFEVSVDEATFVAVSATNVNSGARATTATAVGIYAIPAAGRVVRARCSAFTSGPAVVTLSASNGTPDFVSLAGVSGGAGSVVDTELPPAALLDGTLNPVTTTPVPTVGAVMMGETQGGTGAVSTVKTHTSSSDARANTINGAVTQSRLYVHNHNTPGTGTDDLVRSASAAANNTGTGLLGAGLLAFDGTNFQLLKADTTANPNLRVAMYQGGTGPAVILNSTVDTNSTANNGLLVQSQQHIYNGTSWEKQRSNIDVTLLASASRSTTQNSADITTYNAVGIHVVLDLTVLPGAAVSNVVTIEGKDAVSGKYYTILAGAAIVGVSTNVYKVFPSATVTANVSANDHLPRTIRISVTAGNGNSATYSVGYSLLV